MGLRYEENEESIPDVHLDESPEELNHRREIRKLLEERLERKRLREEIDELDGEFDWSELDR